MLGALVKCGLEGFFFFLGGGGGGGLVVSSCNLLFSALLNNYQGFPMAIHVYKYM